MTVKELRDSINSKKLDDFKLQKAIKFFAENIESMTFGEEAAFESYIKKGAEFLNIDIIDVKAVYNFYK